MLLSPRHISFIIITTIATLLAIYAPAIFLVLLAVAWLIAIYEIVKLPSVAVKWWQKAIPIIGIGSYYLLLDLHYYQYGVQALKSFILIVVFDTFAYIFGKNFGRKKLCPTLSPNKTWEGFIGGVLSCLLVSWALFEEPIYFAVLVACLAQAGDLYGSWLKRLACIKDSGKLIPGHGGVLDRIDSSTFIWLIFLL
jgi:phosphatidate cytidylyltransferase